MNKKKIFISATLLLIFLLSISMFMGAYLYKHGYTTNLSHQLEAWSNVLSNKINQTVQIEENDKKNYINTNNYKFNFRKMTLPSMSRYGALEVFDGNLLFIDGQGSLFEIGDNDTVGKIPLPKIATNSKDFNIEYGSNFPTFSIKDMVIGSKNGKTTMFLSSIGFDNKEKCYFMSVFSSRFTKINGVYEFSDFKNIFNSSPCLGRHPIPRGFWGQSSGGRLAYDEGFIYLSIGDFYFDGVNGQNILQSKDSDYGKILKIDPISKVYQAVAQGLRNPQGMALTSIGLFETEHGPQGGDEFNLINLGKVENYGWPKATYGVDYGTKQWPLDENNLNHNLNNFQKPLYFWIPSIGISDLEYVEKNSSLRLWRGDFLISGMRAMSIYRMKMDKERQVIGVEEIPVGIRIRDIEIFNGKIYTLKDGEPVSIHIMQLVND
ncbi:hypothetical protein HOF60_05885 [bacterium]|nr:hypothetical protein [bacterium]